MRATASSRKPPSAAPQFQARLKALGEHPLVGEARGLGLIGGLELVADKNTKRSFRRQHGVGARAVQFAEAEGLIVRAVLGDVLTLSPPLIISAEEIDELFDRLTPRARQDARLGDARAARAIVMPSTSAVRAESVDMNDSVHHCGRAMRRPWT